MTLKTLKDKKFSAKSFSFLVYDTVLVTDNILRFRCKILKRIQKLIMTIDEKIRDEKIHNDINREALKISALPSGSNYHHKYLTGKEILLPDQSIMIENAKLIYCPLDKSLNTTNK